jgi:hypothetical protein
LEGTIRLAKLFLVLALALTLSPATSTRAQSTPPSSPGGFSVIEPNGNFEEGTFNGFTLLANTEGQILSSFGSTPAFEGSYFALLTQNGGTGCSLGIEHEGASMPKGKFAVIAAAMGLFTEVPSGDASFTITCSNASTGQVLGTRTFKVPPGKLHALSSPENGFGFCTQTLRLRETFELAEPTDVQVSLTFQADGLDSGDMAVLIDDVEEGPTPKFDCTVVPRLPDRFSGSGRSRGSGPSTGLSPFRRGNPLAQFESPCQCPTRGKVDVPSRVPRQVQRRPWPRNPAAKSTISPRRISIGTSASSATSCAKRGFPSRRSTTSCRRR